MDTLNLSSGLQILSKYLKVNERPVNYNNSMVVSVVYEKVLVSEMEKLISLGWHKLFYADSFRWAFPLWQAPCKENGKFPPAIVRDFSRIHIDDKMAIYGQINIIAKDDNKYDRPHRLPNELLNRFAIKWGKKHEKDVFVFYNFIRISEVDDAETEKLLYVKTFVTKFCNKEHFLKNGRPKDHKCSILNKDKLYAEMRGDNVNWNE